MSARYLFKIPVFEAVKDVKCLLEAYGNLDICGSISGNRHKKIITQLIKGNWRYEKAGIAHIAFSAVFVPSRKHPDSREMTSIAVPGSFTAGDKAREAISDKTTAPKRGS